MGSTILTCIIPLHPTLQIRTIVQGYPLIPSTLDDLLKEIRTRLALIETELASNPVNSFPSTPPLQSIFEAALFSLQFLDLHAAPTVVIFTDGVLGGGEPNLSDYDDLLMEISREDVIVNMVLLCSSTPDPNTCFGYMSDHTLLRKVVESTGGSLVLMEDLLEENGKVGTLGNSRLAETMMYRVDKAFF